MEARKRISSVSSIQYPNKQQTTTCQQASLKHGLYSTGLPVFFEHNVSGIAKLL
jgi:hypothetical protein